MNVNTFLEAQKLYNKYSLCESVLEYLSDEEKPQGQKYLETLKMFVNVFPNDFMMFVHNKMLEVGAMFEELHCPEHSESGLQPPTLPPTEEKEPKFPIGSKVEVVSGIGKGGIGVVKDYDPKIDRYYVVSDSFYMWFDESDLAVYNDESEVTPSVRDFSIYDRIEIVAGALTGMKGTVVGLDAEDNLLDVVLDGDKDSSIFTPTEVRKIKPENSEENGGTVEADTGE